MELAEDLAKFVLGLALTDELPGIALRAMEAGYDSPSLRILASDVIGSRYGSSERRALLDRALEELRFRLPTPDEATMTIARSFARGVLARSLTAYEGARRIWRLCRFGGYPKELLPFVGLASEYEDDEDEAHRDEYARQIIERCGELVAGREPELGHTA